MNSVIVQVHVMKSILIDVYKSGAKLAIHPNNSY